MIQVQQLNAWIGAKWNPFTADIPVDRMHIDDSVSRFCWKAEQLVQDGGYALISGPPGSGKSVALRQLHKHLLNMPDLCVRIMLRPQSRLRDFYREMAVLFGIELQSSNRYGGFQKLRQQWLGKINTSQYRPVLLIDEAQEVPEEVLSELRILGSSELDARNILAAVFAGDGRFLANLQSPALQPLDSRIRIRMHMNTRTQEDMQGMLVKSMLEAGCPDLMTPGVIKAISEQSLGNPRAMMLTANELLSHALYRELRLIDESVYFEVYNASQKRKK